MIFLFKYESMEKLGIILNEQLALIDMPIETRVKLFRLFYLNITRECFEEY